MISPATLLSAGAVLELAVRERQERTVTIDGHVQVAVDHRVVEEEVHVVAARAGIRENASPGLADQSWPKSDANSRSLWGSCRGVSGGNGVYSCFPLAKAALSASSRDVISTGSDNTEAGQP